MYVYCVWNYTEVKIYLSDYETSGRISDRSIEWDGRQDFSGLIW